jgi:hypothetical protein
MLEIGLTATGHHRSRQNAVHLYAVLNPAIGLADTLAGTRDLGYRNTHRSPLSRNSRMAAAISVAWVSSAK